MQGATQQAAQQQQASNIGQATNHQVISPAASPEIQHNVYNNDPRGTQPIAVPPGVSAWDQPWIPKPSAPDVAPVGKPAIFGPPVAQQQPTPDPWSTALGSGIRIEPHNVGWQSGPDNSWNQGNATNQPFPGASMYGPQAQAAVPESAASAASAATAAAVLAAAAPPAQGRQWVTAATASPSTVPAASTAASTLGLSVFQRMCSGS